MKGSGTNALLPQQAATMIKQLLPEVLSRLFLILSLARALFFNDNSRLFQVWIGSGKNGKSHLTRLLSLHFPEARAVTKKVLKEGFFSASGAATADFFALLEARLVYCEELGKEKLSGNQLKRLIGGAPVAYRHAYKHTNASASLRSLFVLPVNALPVIDLMDRAIANRFISINFKVRFDRFGPDDQPSRYWQPVDETATRAHESSSFRFSMIALFAKSIVSEAALAVAAKALKAKNLLEREPALTDTAQFVAMFRRSTTHAIPLPILRKLWDKVNPYKQSSENWPKFAILFKERGFTCTHYFSRAPFCDVICNHTSIFFMSLTEDAFARHFRDITFVAGELATERMVSILENNQPSGDEENLDEARRNVEDFPTRFKAAVGEQLYLSVLNTCLIEEEEFSR